MRIAGHLPSELMIYQKLLAQLKPMGVQQLLDKHFPTHGNWQGLSLGWVVSVWRLAHLIRV